MLLFSFYLLSFIFIDHSYSIGLNLTHTIYSKVLFWSSLNFFIESSTHLPGTAHRVRLSARSCLSIHFTYLSRRTQHHNSVVTASATPHPLTIPICAPPPQHSAAIAAVASAAYRIWQLRLSIGCMRIIYALWEAAVPIPNPNWIVKTAWKHL